MIVRLLAGYVQDVRYAAVPGWQGAVLVGCSEFRSVMQRSLFQSLNFWYFFMQQSTPISQLLNIMSRLRDPESGCPWDLKQDFASIVPHTLEEAYEVADAIEQGDYAELKLELGDLLFQVVFYAQLAKEQELFDFDEIVQGISEKLIRRHPHIFSQTQFKDENAIKANWEQEKAKERLAKQGTNTEQPSVLDDIPKAMPALSRANKIQKRCATVGFDWTELGPVIDKIREEIEEVEAELHRPVNEEALTEELGDLMFAVVNLSRHLKRDPEQTLRKANDKFEKRFRLLEQLALAQGKQTQDCSLDELEELWQKVKARK